MPIYVQFFDSKKTSIIAAFAGPQDENDVPNQGEVEEGDARYQAFLSLVSPQPTLADAIAARRYQAEAAGISVGGMPVATDRDSQGLINGAALSAFMDDTYTCNWKTADGFVKLDAKTILAVARAVRNHVQACFDREGELVSAVQAGTYKPEMLDQGWPA